MLAPFLPFVTEEAWSEWQPGSIHREPWPSADELRAVAGADAAPALLAAASEVLEEIRRAKSTAKLPMRAPVTSVAVTGPPARLEVLRAALDDLGAAGYVGEWSLSEDGDGDGSLAISVSLDEAAVAERSQAG
jgi:valyl-tRNA synthetase